MELRRYFTFIRHWLWLILLCMILSAAGALIFSLTSTRIYQASATLLISQAPSTNATTDYNSIQTSSLLAKTYKELLVKRPVLERVISNLGLKITPEQLVKKITVTLVKDTQLLSLAVEDPDPKVAALVANEIGSVFRLQNQDLQTSRYTSTKQSLQEELTKIQSDITQTQEALDKLKIVTTPEQITEQNRLQTNLAQYRNSYATLLKSFEDVRLAEAQATSNVSVVEGAQVPELPVKPTTTLNTILAAVIGLLLGLGIAFLIEYLDDTVKSGEQVQSITGVSALGIIARIKESELPARIITFKHPNSAISEAYRILRANIEFSEIDEPIQTIVITSGSSGEGKTTTAANLAVAIAQTGKKVILVDTDLRRPMLHQYFELTNTRGVTTALLEHEPKIEEHLMSTKVPNLTLLPSGPLPPNPAELLDSNRMLELIEQLKSLAEVVIFDSPPIMAVVDPVLLARMCDVSLMVVQSGSTRITTLKKVREQLGQSGTRLLGIVLNRVTISHGSSYNNYYYYGYPSSKKERQGKDSKKSQLPFLGKVHSNGHKEIVKPEEISTSSQNGSSNGTGAKTAVLHKKEVETKVTRHTSEPEYKLLPVEDIKKFESLTQIYGVLAVKGGPSSGHYLELRSNRVLIGRRGTNASNQSGEVLIPNILIERHKPAELTKEVTVYFTLNDPQLSRDHLEIVQKPDGSYLRDLNSLNGTWLNGKKMELEPLLLNEGAEIRLGDNTLMIYSQKTH